MGVWLRESSWKEQRGQGQEVKRKKSRKPLEEVCVGGRERVVKGEAGQ